jgi:hypothetical protein
MKASKITEFYEMHITDNLTYKVLVLFTTELSTMTAGMEMGMDMKTVLTRRCFRRSRFSML